MRALGLHFTLDRCAACLVLHAAAPGCSAPALLLASLMHASQALPVLPVLLCVDVRALRRCGALPPADAGPQPRPAVPAGTEWTMTRPEK